MPFHAESLPIYEPFHLFAGANKELHLHLFKFAHAEYKLTCNDFVTESLTDLCNTERYLHTASFPNVKKVHKDTLSSLWTQENLHSSVRCRTHFGAKHQIELANFCPVFGT